MTHGITSLKTRPHVIGTVLEEMTHAHSRTTPVTKYIEICKSLTLTVPESGVLAQLSTTCGMPIASNKFTGVCYVT